MSFDGKNVDSLLVDQMDDFTPEVTHFRGVLSEVEIVEKDYEGRKQIRLNFNFTGLEVLDSPAPYTFPVYTLSVAHSEKASSMFGIFNNSARKVLGTKVAWSELYGRNFEITWNGGHMVRRPNEAGDWVPTEIKAWEVLSVDGGETVTLADLANGKNDAEFKKAILQSGDMNAKARVMNGEIGDVVAEMVKAKEIKVKDGVYSKI